MGISEMDREEEERTREECEACLSDKRRRFVNEFREWGT